MIKQTVCFFAVLLLAGCAVLRPAPKTWKDLDVKIYHLGTKGQPEWLEFANDPPHGRELAMPFPAELNAAEYTLLLWQSDVKQTWPVAVNGRKLGQLDLNEVPVISAYALPAGALKKDNVLTVSSPKKNDDILVGMIRIEPRPLAEVLGESTLEIDVVEPIAGGGIPCRITIVDEALNALPPLTATPGQRLAVRHGVVYTGDGRARVTLPAGRYRVHAGRGFEYSVATEHVSVSAGQTRKVSLKIPAGSDDGKLLRLKGRGAPKLKGSGRGDLLARVRVTVPKKLSKAEKHALEELKKVSKEDPRERAFNA